MDKNESARRGDAQTSYFSCDRCGEKELCAQIDKKYCIQAKRHRLAFLAQQSDWMERR